MGTGTIRVTTTYEVITCSQCGIGFGLPSHFETKRLEDHATFYCPNGHGQHFPQESEAEALRRRLKAQERHVERLNHQLDEAQGSLRATKGVVTRLRKRAITGTCAFCHRHFANVELHVASQHPGEQA